MPIQEGLKGLRHSLCIPLDGSFGGGGVRGQIMSREGCIGQTFGTACEPAATAPVAYTRRAVPALTDTNIVSFVHGNHFEVVPAPAPQNDDQPLVQWCAPLKTLEETVTSGIFIARGATWSPTLGSGWPFCAACQVMAADSSEGLCWGEGSMRVPLLPAAASLPPLRPSPLPALWGGGGSEI